MCCAPMWAGLLVPAPQNPVSPPQQADTTDQQTDTVRRHDIDTIVYIRARDTVHYRAGTKTMYLRGKSVVSYEQQKLEANRIDMDFGTSTITAQPSSDSAGRQVGFPVFSDNGQEFAGARMTYNFKTGKGNVVFGETTVEGGFYYGDRIKRVGQRTAFVEDGCYTTCDAPKPHFYFNSPKMKIELENKIYLNPVILYVEDIPVFALPFGLFFSTEHGRRSGFIMPSPLITSNRGVALQNLGYYFAISDYFDTELTADITTKGGFTLYNRSRWALRDYFSGNAEFRYGYTRFNTDSPYQMNLGISVNHSQQLRPMENIAVNVLLTSQKYYQNTSFNPYDRLQQIARSTASYQRSFFNGTTLNLNMVRDENMVNGSVTNSPTVNLSIPQWFPLRSLKNTANWLADVSVQYRVVGRYFQSSLRTSETDPFVRTEYTTIEHRPAITISPKIGYFTLQPTISYSENWYAQQYTQSINPADSTLTITRSNGLFREYTYGAGVAASTFLYGMAYPRIFGISAIRHTLQPVVGITYIPDQSDSSLGFYGYLTSPITGRQTRYHRFAPAGQLASPEQQANITLSLLNKISIKPESDTADTVAPRPFDVLTFTLNTSYNLASDSLRLRPISFSLRSPVLDAIEFSAAGVFNVYDQDLVQDEATGRMVWRDVNRWTGERAGGGLARLTSLSVQLGTRFSSSGVNFEPRKYHQESSDTTQDGATLRNRFGQRLNFQEEAIDLFGDTSPGWQPLTMPWNISFSLAYAVNKPTPDYMTESLFLAFQGNLTITQTLSVSAMGSYDILNHTVNSPIIDIRKQIHCWNLSLNWVPTGFNRGFFLRFSAAAPQLQGLVIQKQNTPLYR